MKCLILAGGFATRLYPLTLNRAKALLEYQGKPVVSHIIDKVPPIVQVLVATNRKFEADFLAWRQTVRRHVEIGFEEATSDEKKKGAVGAVDFWVKTKHIDDDLMVIAADNYFDFDLGQMIDAYDGHDVMVAVYDVGDKEKACEIGKACQVGLVTVEEDRVISLDEKPAEATSSIIATGIYILPRRTFAILDRYCREAKRDNMGSLISYVLERETVRAFTFKGTWMDIGDEVLRGRLTV